ncbi:MAG: redox-sensing transcriptional repressor Rex [Eubacterium sp.]|nr:redox-sensing transcriptional repressor Rex [Eubacterium sp.]
MSRVISNAVIRRMPRYYRYLGELLDRGIERISSNELSHLMNVTASQIRQDLNNFGGFGQQGYGYNVQYLYEEIGKILGLDVTHNIVILGAGNLGQALAGYVQFEKKGFKIIGLFDVNKDIVGMSVRGTKVRSIDELHDFVKENHVDIAAFTMPKDKAEAMAKTIVNLGIKAIWNFANMELSLPEDIIVENVHLSDSLMQLSYNIAKYNREQK